MPNKCCVALWKTNYASVKPRKEKAPQLFSFPKDTEKRQQWLNALPNVIEAPTKNMKVCSLHWSPDAEKEKVFQSKCYLLFFILYSVLKDLLYNFSIDS